MSVWVVWARKHHRWQRSDGTQVSPSEFIPICEETGMIVEVGTWVLREACRQFMQWRAEGLSQLNRLAVNISPRQFAQDNFVETVISIVKESGILLPCLNWRLLKTFWRIQTRSFERCQSSEPRVLICILMILVPAIARLPTQTAAN